MRVPRPGKPVDKPGKPSRPVRPGPRLGIKDLKAKLAEKRALKASKQDVTIMPVPPKPGSGRKTGRPVPPRKVR